VLGTPPQRGLHATQLVVANRSTQFFSAVLSLSAVYYASQVHKRTVTGHRKSHRNCVTIVPNDDIRVTWERKVSIDRLSLAARVRNKGISEL